MKLFRVTLTVILTAALFACMLCVPSLAEEYPSVTAEAAVVYCPDNGRFVFEKNADTFMPIASLTKIMTALVAIENNDPNEIVSIDKRAVGIEGSSVYLCEDEKLSVDELVYALMLESANDAAVALALHTAGSVETFAELMNAKALELGLLNTSFVNPNGLDANGHGSSARDLAFLTGRALENELFAEAVSTKTRSIPYCGKENGRYLLNHNRMLSLYDGAKGVKTGFTRTAGRCLVSCAERDGVTLIAVTLNAPNDWNDHIVMLDYGFSQLKSVTFPDAARDFPIHVVSGSVSDITARAEPVTVTLDAGIEPSSELVCLRRFYFAPVTKGDILGAVVYKSNGEVVATAPIIALESSEQIKFKRNLFERLIDFFK